MPSRRRTYNLRLIKATWPYTVQEVSELLGVHKNAVLRWLREGLAADQDRRPFLIRGDVLKAFLSARQTGRKRKCQSTEFFCFKCRAPRPAYLGIADIVIESLTRMRLKALCGECGTPVNKVQAVRDLHEIRRRFEIQKVTGEHVWGCAEASLNDDSHRSSADNEQ